MSETQDDVYTQTRELNSQSIKRYRPPKSLFTRQARKLVDMPVVREPKQRDLTHSRKRNNDDDEYDDEQPEKEEEQERPEPRPTASEVRVNIPRPSNDKYRARKHTSRDRGRLQIVQQQAAALSNAAVQAIQALAPNAAAGNAAITAVNTPKDTTEWAIQELQRIESEGDHDKK